MTTSSMARPTTAIGILGAAGRMGRAIAAAADERGVLVAGAVGRDDDVAALGRVADVLIDFTRPDALAGHLAAAVATGTPILIGTTGLGADENALIDHAAAAIPIVQAANTSLGIVVLSRLVGQAARALGDGWDIEIVEMHHRHKLDAPSGTALLLGASASVGRGAADGEILNHLDRMRAGAHPREDGGIYYASLRGGSVAGDHSVVFAGDGERIELIHRAEGRAIFAAGALRAALWLAEGRAAGRYTMTDVLGLA